MQHVVWECHQDAGESATAHAKSRICGILTNRRVDAAQVVVR